MATPGPSFDKTVPVKSIGASDGGADVAGTSRDACVATRAAAAGDGAACGGASGSDVGGGSGAGGGGSATSTTSGGGGGGATGGPADGIQAKTTT
jgi:hypothetical protein